MFEWILNGGGVPLVVGSYAVVTGSDGQGSETYSAGSLSKDGATLVLRNNVNKQVLVFKLIDGLFKLTQTIVKGTYNEVVVSGDGSVIAMQYGAYHVAIYKRNLEGVYVESQTLFGTNYSGYGTTITISDDGTVLAINAYALKYTYIFKPDGDGLYSQVGIIGGGGSFGRVMSMSGNGKVIASTDDTRRISVHRENQQGSFSRESYIDSNPTSLKVSYSGESVYTAGSNITKWVKQPDLSYQPVVIASKNLVIAITDDEETVVGSDYRTGVIQIYNKDPIGGGYIPGQVIEMTTPGPGALMLAGDGGVLVARYYGVASWELFRKIQ